MDGVLGRRVERGMDPNAALAKIRTILIEGRSDESGDPASSPLSPARTEELLEAVADLDEWLSKGGFLPDAWQKEKSSGRPARYTPTPADHAALAAYAKAHGRTWKFKLSMDWLRAEARLVSPGEEVVLLRLRTANGFNLSAYRGP